MIKVLLCTFNCAELYSLMLGTLVLSILCFIKQVKKNKGGNLYVSKSNVADCVRAHVLGILHLLGCKRSTDGENSF